MSGAQRVGSPGRQAQGSPGALQANSPVMAICTDELDQVRKHEL